MRYATHYDVGERKRDEGINEDSVALTVFEQGHREGYCGQRVTPSSDARSRPANRGAAAVALADGAGGHDAGDVASYIASTVVCEQLADVVVRAARGDPDPFDVSLTQTPDVPTAANLRGAVADAIVAAHREIIANAATGSGGAYATVVAGIVVDGQFHYGWVGDSRAYLINSATETISRLTRDHAVVEQLQQSGAVDEAEARVHPRGNEITRALGGSGSEDPTSATVSVETASVEVYAEDTLLVTSDGLIDAQTDAPQLHDAYVDDGRSDAAADRIHDAVVTDTEVRDAVLNAGTLESAAATLIELANARGGKDNLSTLLLRDETLPETPAETDLRYRDIDETKPIEQRETVVLPDE
jgi:serine/threonine protein phosphatase PrpC